jgi:hypothetical protein
MRVRGWLHRGGAAVDPEVQIPGATPPTVPMRRSDLPTGPRRQGPSSRPASDATGDAPEESVEGDGTGTA